MLNQSKPKLDNRSISQTINDLFEPRSQISYDLGRRSRLFNILLASQTLLAIIATPFALLSRRAELVLIALLVLLAGAAIAYALNRVGLIARAGWANNLSTIIGIVAYTLATPYDAAINPQALFMDYHSSVMLMALPLVTSGVVSGVRACLPFTALSLLTFSVLGLGLVVPIAPLNHNGNLSFYLSLFRVPLSFLALSSVVAIMFERNVVSLFSWVAERNIYLQGIAEQLNLKRNTADQLTFELKNTLANLRLSFEGQLSQADEQQWAIKDVGVSLDELSRVAHRIDNLASQANHVTSQAVEVAKEGANVVLINSVAYGELHNQLELINHSIVQLTLEARQIDQIVSSITEIAEETNLLSLNASIESAGHREHGRRFATVASEVQRLAQRSRDAAEEVRRVVEQIQTSVEKLAAFSAETQIGAADLTKTGQASAMTVDEIVTSVEYSAQISQNILGGIQNQQTSVINITDAMPSVAAKSDSLRGSTRRLLNVVLDLEELLDSLKKEYKPQEPVALGSLPFEEEDLPLRGASGRINWRNLWRFVVSPSMLLPIVERRPSRLLNILSLLFGVFLLFYLPLLQLTNAPFFSALSTFFLVTTMVFTLSKIGYYRLALPIFFASFLLTFTLSALSIPDQFEMRDFIRTSSGLLGLPILMAVIVAGQRAIYWMTGLGIAFVLGFALILVDLSQASYIQIVLFPSGLLLALGVLAAFLYSNINRLTAVFEEQNEQLNASNHELGLKERQENELSQHIQRLIGELATHYTYQADLAIVQLKTIQEMTRRTENLERSARQLVMDTQQASQKANQALQHAEEGASSIQSGLRVIEKFQNQVAQIATNSTDLRTQAGEITQTFDLINDVAEEIDLLALNATVEAAQAREAGRRFAAVAGEVQRLAARARNANTAVRSIIARIQEAVVLCVDSTQRGQSEIAILSRATYETTYSIQDIVQNVGNTSNLIDQIQDAVQQQALAITQVLKRLREISAVGANIQKNTHATGMGLNQLNTIAARLNPTPTPTAVETT